MEWRGLIITPDLSQARCSGRIERHIIFVSKERENTITKSVDAKDNTRGGRTRLAWRKGAEGKIYLFTYDYNNKRRSRPCARQATRDSSTSREPVRGYEGDGWCRKSRVSGRKGTKKRLMYEEDIIINRGGASRNHDNNSGEETHGCKKKSEEWKRGLRESSPLQVKTTEESAEVP